MDDHPVDATIRSFARVMTSPPDVRAARLAEFSAAWKRLRASDPREDVESLAQRVARLGVPAGQALLDVSQVVAEAGAKSTAAKSKSTAAKATPKPAKAKATKAKPAKAKAVKVTKAKAVKVTKAKPAKATKAKPAKAKAKPTR